MYSKMPFTLLVHFVNQYCCYTCGLSFGLKGSEKKLLLWVFGTNAKCFIMVAPKANYASHHDATEPVL